MPTMVTYTPSSFHNKKSIATYNLILTSSQTCDKKAATASEIFKCYVNYDTKQLFYVILVLTNGFIFFSSRPYKELTNSLQTMQGVSKTDLCNIQVDYLYIPC